MDAPGIWQISYYNGARVEGRLNLCGSGMGDIMHHISDLQLSQFRGLQNVRLSGLGQINLLIGGNNSGKTSVLEAIAIFCRPLDPWEWIRAARSREIQSSRTPIGEALKWLFPQSEDAFSNGFYQGSIGMSGTGSFPVRDVTATLREFLIERHQRDDEEVIGEPVRGADLTLQARIASQQHALAPPDVLTETFRFQEDERFAQRPQSNRPMLAVNTISPQAHRVEPFQIHRLSETALQELDSSAVSILQMFDPGVEDIEIWSQSGIRPTLYIRHRQFGLAPLSSFGDGMRRILLMATTIPLCQNGVLLIDELETAIHTQVLEKAFDWLIQHCVQHHIQMVATTHSLETLDAVLGVSREPIDLVVYRLEREAHQTTATALDKPLLTMLRQELGQEVRW